MHPKANLLLAINQLKTLSRNEIVDISDDHSCSPSLGQQSARMNLIEVPRLLPISFRIG